MDIWLLELLKENKGKIMMIIAMLLAFYSYILSILTKHHNIAYSIPIITILILLIDSLDKLETMIPDYQNYWWAFDRALIGSNDYRYEVGYRKLSEFFGGIGFNFPFFNEFLLVLSVVLLFVAVLNFKGNTTIFLSLYFVTVFFIDIVQTRNTIAMSLLLFLFSFINNMKIRTYIWIIVSTIIAMLFQNISIFFIILLFSLPINKCRNHYVHLVKMMRYVFNVLLSISLLSIVVVPGVFRSILTHVSNFIPYSYATSILQNNNTTYSFIIIMIFISALLFFYGYNVEKLYRKKLSYRDMVLVQILKIQPYSLPLLYLATDFQRIIRTSIVVVLIIHSILLREEEYRKNKLLIAIMYFTIIFGSYQLSWKLIFESVIIPVCNYWI